MSDAAAATVTVTVETPLRPGRRRGSPRAVGAVRARIAHTATNKRRLDVFVTGPALARLGWRTEGRVAATLSSTPYPATVTLTPSHFGLKLCRHSKPTTATIRVGITADAIQRGVCAPVRDVPFEVRGDRLVVDLPAEWFRAPAQAAE